MIFESTGRVAEGLTVLGPPQVPVYLVEGERPVLVDAGIACLGGMYERAARAAGVEPAWLCLTHPHFDHVGSAARLRRAFPGMRVAASEKVVQVLARPRVVSSIEMLGEAARSLAEHLGAVDLVDDGFETFEVDRVVGDGDVLDLGGGQTLHAIHAPGHTWDFLSWWNPERGILVASEAVGCADATGYVFTEFLVDHGAYMESLRRLASLEPEVLCQGHWFVYTGADARDRLDRAIEAGERFALWVRELLDEEHGDVERVKARVRAVEWDPKPEPKQPLPAYLLNLDARVRHLASSSPYA